MGWAGDVSEEVSYILRIPGLTICRFLKAIMPGDPNLPWSQLAARRKKIKSET